MERVRISIPEDLPFFIEEKVRVSDLNYGNHLGNDAVLSLLHEGRMQFLNSFGWDEMDLAGVGLIMADSAIEYKSEGFLGDRLKIFVGFGRKSPVGFDLLYRIEKRDGQLVAKAKTGMICFDYDKRKIVSLPEEVTEKIKS